MMIPLFSSFILQIPFGEQLTYGIIVLAFCFIVVTWIYYNQDDMNLKEYGLFMFGIMIFTSVMLGLITWSFNNFLLYGSGLIGAAFVVTWKRKKEDEI
jgi:uncharacterized membrane protein YfcA